MPGYATYSYDSINSSFQPRKELAYNRSRWSLYLLAEEIFRRHIYILTSSLRTPKISYTYAYPEIVKAGDRLVSLGRYR